MHETTIRGHGVPFGQMIAGSWVREAGANRRGRPVVLLHGLGATAGLNWFGTFEPLSRRHRVLAPDLLGHGRTPCEGGFSIARAADAVASVLDELGVDHAVVVGYSMGGAVAQLLAHRRPELVDGLVLAATSRDFRGRPADRFRFTAASVLALGTRAVPTLPLSLLTSVVRGRDGERWWAAAEVSRSSPSAVCGAADALGRFTSRAWVGELDVPSTVLLTTRDRVVPPSRQAKLAHGLARSRLVPIEGDHLIVARSPALFGAAVVDAVADVERRVGGSVRRRVISAVA